MRARPRASRVPATRNQSRSDAETRDGSGKNPRGAGRGAWQEIDGAGTDTVTRQAKPRAGGAERLKFARTSLIAALGYFPIGRRSVTRRAAGRRALWLASEFPARRWIPRVRP